MTAAIYVWRIVMLFSNIGIIDENFDYKDNMYVGVEKNTIKYVGCEKPSADFGETYDGKGKVLLSGFVNAHTHSPMTLLRGYAENLPLDRWLNEKVFPFEDKIQDEDAYYSSLLGIAEMLKYGTTSFTDMYFFSESVANAVIDSGIKCNFGRAITSFSDCDINEIASFRESEAVFKNYHGEADGRFLVDMSLHAEYTNRPIVIEQFAEVVKEHKLNAHIHLSETQKEHEECKQRNSGLTPTQLFEKCGVFDVPTTAAHCVWLEDGDVEILKDKGVTVATCPASNLKLGSGVCDIDKLLKNQVNVAVGTDSVSSNNNFNILKDIYLCATLPKGFFHKPDIVSEKDVLKMATVNGYRSQGRFDCGKISVGCRADLIVMDIDTVSMCPHTDVLNNLVYAANGADVVLTMVDGNVLYKDGEFLSIDIEKIKFEVEKRTKRIITEVNKNA